MHSHTHGHYHGHPGVTHYHTAGGGLDCANILLCGALIGCFAASPRNFVFGCIAAITAVVVISCLASLAMSVTGETLLSLFLIGVVAVCVASICKNNGLCTAGQSEENRMTFR